MWGKNERQKAAFARAVRNEGNCCPLVPPMGSYQFREKVALAPEVKTAPKTRAVQRLSGCSLYEVLSLMLRFHRSFYNRNPAFHFANFHTGEVSNRLQNSFFTCPLFHFVRDEIVHFFFFFFYFSAILISNSVRPTIYY